MCFIPVSIGSVTVSAIQTVVASSVKKTKVAVHVSLDNTVVWFRHAER